MASAAKAATLPVMSLGGASSWFGMTTPDQVQQLTDRQLAAILGEKASANDPLTQAVRDEYSKRNAGTSQVDTGPSIFADHAITYRPDGYMTVAPFAVGPQNSALGNLGAALGNGLIGGIPTAFARAGQDIWSGVDALKKFAITPEGEVAKQNAAQVPPAPALTPPAPPAAPPAPPANLSFDLPGSPMPQPPQMVAPSLTAPTPMGAPPQQAALPAPDFSSYDAAIAGAAPTPTSQEEFDKQKQNLWLQGLAGGLAGFDGSQPGAWGQGWAKIAAGGLGGISAADQQRLQIQREDNKAAQEYALTKATGEWNKGSVQRDVVAANNKIDFGNKSAVYDVTNQNNKNETDFKNANATNQAEAQNKNAANAYAANLKMYELSQPEVKSVPGGLAITTKLPDGKTHVEVMPQNTIEDKIKQLDFIQKTEAALGPDSSVAIAARYAQSSPFDKNLDVMTRILKSGRAEQVFGPTFQANFDKIRAELLQRLKPDPILQADVKFQEKLQAQVIATTAQILMADPAVAGSSAWIQQAAALGDVGALMILQGH